MGYCSVEALGNTVNRFFFNGVTDVKTTQLNTEYLSGHPLILRFWSRRSR